MLDDGTPASAIATPDGRLVYATDEAEQSASVLSRELLGQALGGTVASELVTTDVNGVSTKVFRAYAPFRLADGSSGVLVVDKDYGPIAAAARRAAITVAVVLEGVLLALWLCLFPIMRSVTRRMNRQLDTIAHQALHDDLTGLANRTQFGQRLDEALEAEGDEAEGAGRVLHRSRAVQGGQRRARPRLGQRAADGRRRPTRPTSSARARSSRASAVTSSAC